MFKTQNTQHFIYSFCKNMSPFEQFQHQHIWNICSPWDKKIMLHHIAACPCAIGIFENTKRVENTNLFVYNL